MKTLLRISKTLSLAGILFTTNTYALPSFSYPVPKDNDIVYSFGIPSKQSLPRRMNILVWNLHKGANDTFPTDFGDLAYQKDLLINQEMQLDARMRSVFSGLPLDYFTTATSFFIGKDLARTGVSTASSVKPIETEFVRTVILEPVVNSPKVTLVTQYPIQNSDKKLTVINIHGINFVDADSYRKEINRIYDEVKNIPAPLIFAGDFNSWSEERNLILKEMADKLKLREANFFPDNRMRFNKHPLDHFYYTDDIKVIDAKVEEFYQGSDHKPLELVIEYSPLLKLAKRH